VRDRADFRARLAAAAGDGALTVLLGMALFAVIVFRTSGQERAMPVGAEQRAGVFHFENKA
jgi:hypothetical protein